MKVTKTQIRTILEYSIVITMVFVLKAFTLQGPVYDLCAEDNSIYFIFGREILNGKVLYTDLIDQKGVYIFLIYALAAMISKTSQIGVYLIYSVLISIAICYMYNTLRLKLSAVVSIVSTFFITLMMCWTPLMTFNGYNEDYIMLCYFITIISLYRHCDENYSNPRIMCLYGILSGIILNLKPNYVIFYIPIAIHMLYTTLKDKKYNITKNNIIYGLFSVFVANIPMLIYTLTNNCFNEMIHELYGNNGFNVYGQYDLQGMIPFIKTHLSFLLVVMLLSIIVIVNTKKDIAFLYISLNIMALVGALMSGRPYVHYIEVLVVFYIPVIVYVTDKLFKLKVKIAPFIIYLSVAYVLLTYNGIYSDALYDLYTTDYANYGIYKTANLYRDKYYNYKNIVYIGYGGLIYYNTDVVVDKYPSVPSIPFDKYTDAIYYKEDRIRNENPEMIIIQTGFVDLIKAKFSDDIINLFDTNYTSIDDYFDEYNIENYIFYIRNDLLEEE